MLATRIVVSRPGAAGLLHVVGGGLGSEAGAEHALPGQVAVAGVLEHGAAGDLAEPLALQREAVDSPSSAAVSMSWLDARE